MVYYTSELKELKKNGFYLLISDYLFKIGRDDDYTLLVSFNGVISNDIDRLCKEAKEQFYAILDRTNFEILQVKGIDYIFNKDNFKERHIVAILTYLAKDYEDVLNDYSLSDMEFCDNGDVHVDGVIIHTRISIYEINHY